MLSIRLIIVRDKSHAGKLSNRSKAAAFLNEEAKEEGVMLNMTDVVLTKMIRQTHVPDAAVCDWLVKYLKHKHQFAQLTAQPLPFQCNDRVQATCNGHGARLFFGTVVAVENERNPSVTIHFDDSKVPATAQPISSVRRVMPQLPLLEVGSKVQALWGGLQYACTNKLEDKFYPALIDSISEDTYGNKLYHVIYLDDSGNVEDLYREYLVPQLAEASN